MRRVIVTLDQSEALRRGVPLPTVVAKAAYGRSVEQAGGLPLFVAPTADPAVRDAVAQTMDALVVTGGSFDIAPELYGEARSAQLGATKPERTGFEWFLVERALEKRVPILGVCGGMQLLNVVLGGTLLQDIASEVPGALAHEQPTSPLEPAHPVDLEESRLARAIGRTRIHVNTTHHQAIAKLGRGLSVLGRAPDGVIEAIGLDTDERVVGAQWHPELLDDDVARWLYQRLVV
jgi:putative glutamine amidotransferase